MKQDGKYLEKAVEKAFKENNAWYHRLNDSAAGRNLTSAQPADAICCSNGHSFLLELKSTKVPRRLPRFVQHSRMKLAYDNGLDGYVLVHRYEADIFYLLNIKDLELGKPSHDLREWPELTWSEVIGEVLNG